jgi:predicted heme/steroid binding protein
MARQRKQRDSSKKTTKTTSPESSVIDEDIQVPRLFTFGQAIRALISLICLFFLSSYIITDTWMWGYEGKWTNPRKWFPRRMHTFSESELARYNGSNESLPIYLAIDGQVFDVTEGREHYGPGGAYHFFAGRDASRAFVTGCFDTHLTHDVRGFTTEQLEQLKGWVQFYHEHPRYYHIGYVVHPPISPDTPPPPDCHDAVPQKP